MSRKRILKTAELLALALWGISAFGQGIDANVVKSRTGMSSSRSQRAGEIEVPNRPASSLFQGEQGKQRSEIHYDQTTGVVTIKMVVQDPNGYFIPNIRRDNFAVYENNVRQQNATVEIDHAPVTLAVLLEYGGRRQALNKALGYEVPRAAHQLLDEIGRQDKIALWRYAGKVEQVADFSKGHEMLDGLFSTSQAPEFSETNLYDALISTLQQMKVEAGRKALVLISSGVDTFSKAKYEDVLKAVRECQTPVYVINIGPILRSAEELSPQPYARVDWSRAEAELQKIAQASGGRLYSPGSTLNLSGVYDDMMENLRLRYIITYKSTADGGNLDAARTVRVELVNPNTGRPLGIVDANRKPVSSRLFVQESYVPRGASIVERPELEEK
jgi:Ca-activated chloride channel family protein